MGKRDTLKIAKRSRDTQEFSDDRLSKNPYVRPKVKKGSLAKVN